MVKATKGLVQQALGKKGGLVLSIKNFANYVF
jgi:hypothetical protein